PAAARLRAAGGRGRRRRGRERRLRHADVLRQRTPPSGRLRHRDAVGRRSRGAGARAPPRPGRRVTIGGETRLVALLGHPVAGSLSPRMQNAAFAARGLDWAYVACDVSAEGLEAAVRGLAALGFAGANVTIPHKQAAARLCNEADGDAVNTLVFRDG